MGKDKPNVGFNDEEYELFCGKTVDEFVKDNDIPKEAITMAKLTVILGIIATFVVILVAVAIANPFVVMLVNQFIPGIESDTWFASFVFIVVLIVIIILCIQKCMIRSKCRAYEREHEKD